MENRDSIGSQRMKRKRNGEKTSYGDGKPKLKVQNFERERREREIREDRDPSREKKKKKKKKQKKKNSRNLCSSRPKEIRRRSKHVQTTFPPQSPSSPELIPR